MRESTGLFIRTAIAAAVLSAATVVVLRAAQQPEKPRVTIEFTLFGKKHFLEGELESLEIPRQVINRRLKGDSLLHVPERRYYGPYLGLGSSRVI